MSEKEKEKENYISVFVSWVDLEISIFMDIKCIIALYQILHFLVEGQLNLLEERLSRKLVSGERE